MGPFSRTSQYYQLSAFKYWKQTPQRAAQKLTPQSLESTQKLPKVDQYNQQ